MSYNFCLYSVDSVSLTSIELLLQVLDMGVSSNDVITFSNVLPAKNKYQTPKPVLSPVFETLLSHFILLSLISYHFITGFKTVGS